MLAVYRYVACGLAVTAFPAAFCVDIPAGAAGAGHAVLALY
jgi:hypothetical protein